jgi:hypothetical protein
MAPGLLHSNRGPRSTLEQEERAVTTLIMAIGIIALAETLRAAQAIRAAAPVPVRRPVRQPLRRA